MRHYSLKRIYYLGYTYFNKYMLLDPVPHVILQSHYKKFKCEIIEFTIKFLKNINTKTIDKKEFKKLTQHSFSRTSIFSCFNKNYFIKYCTYVLEYTYRYKLSLIGCYRIISSFLANDMNKKINSYNYGKLDIFKPLMILANSSFNNILHESVKQNSYKKTVKELYNVENFMFDTKYCNTLTRKQFIDIHRERCSKVFSIIMTINKNNHIKKSICQVALAVLYKYFDESTDMYLGYMYDDASKILSYETMHGQSNKEVSKYLSVKSNNSKAIYVLIKEVFNIEIKSHIIDSIIKEIYELKTDNEIKKLKFAEMNSSHVNSLYGFRLKFFQNIYSRISNYEINNSDDLYLPYDYKIRPDINDILTPEQLRIIHYDISKNNRNGGNNGNGGNDQIYHISFDGTQLLNSPNVNLDFYFKNGKTYNFIVDREKIYNQIIKMNIYEGINQINTNIHNNKNIYVQFNDSSLFIHTNILLQKLFYSPKEKIPNMSIINILFMEFERELNNLYIYNRGYKCEKVYFLLLATMETIINKQIKDVNPFDSFLLLSNSRSENYKNVNNNNYESFRNFIKQEFNKCSNMEFLENEYSFNTMIDIITKKINSDKPNINKMQDYRSYIVEIFDHIGSIDPRFLKITYSSYIRKGMDIEGYVFDNKKTWHNYYNANANVLLNILFSFIKTPFHKVNTFKYNIMKENMNLLKNILNEIYK